MSENLYHIPVLLKTSVEALNIKPNGIYVDATFGGGGHSEEILKRLKKGLLLSFDQDQEVQENAKILSNKYPDTFLFIRSNFRYIINFLRFYEINKVDGIIADLGVSSHQFDTAQRGFSFRFEAQLDMRMNKMAQKKASDILNTFTLPKLELLFKNFGELPQAKKIATAIVKAREINQIKTSEQLISVLANFVPAKNEHKFLAQVYQALRIEVNSEIKVLESFLVDIPKYLKENGRLVILTYHSLEDRPVKRFLKTGNINGIANKDFFGKITKPFDTITNKPIEPDKQEINTNNRARSAKLRVGIRNCQEL